MIKTIRIYYPIEESYYSSKERIAYTDHCMNILSSINGIRNIKLIFDNDKDMKGRYCRFKIKCNIFSSNRVDKEIFKRFPKALIFNEKGRRIK